MTDPRFGIDGVDLLELDIIAKERLPDAAAELASARGTIALFSQVSFRRSGGVGIGADGPAAEWSALADLLVSALTQGGTNIDDTSAAIRTFLDDILATDDGARQRMDTARTEMEGIGG